MGAKYTIEKIKVIAKDRNCKVKIQEFLSDNKLNFKEQKSIEGCSNNRELRFDFAVFDREGNILKAIEFDGEQHFRPVDFFGGKEAFDKQVERDGVKNTFCEQESIPLLRIPYTNYLDIEEILSDEFKTILCQA